MRVPGGWRLAVGVVVVLALVAAGAVWYFEPWRAEANVTEAGGEVWNEARDVGVRVARGGVEEPTHIAIAPAAFRPAEAPLAALTEVIGGPVDIAPDRHVSRAQVMFTVADRALSAAGTGDARPSLRNAAIEVYNETLGAWIPLETTVDGDTLVADAPHFSLYRAVVTKIGEFTVNAGRGVRVALDAVTANPVSLWWDVGAAFVDQMWGNFRGRFDDTKFACEQASRKHVVLVHQHTKTEHTDACVVESGGRTKVLLKNAWSFPMLFTTTARKGVTADVHPSDVDTHHQLRNFVGKALGNTALASGLDVASFTVGEDAPTSFDVRGRVSWGGTALDLAVAMLTVLLPEAALARVLSTGTDIATCLFHGGQKLDSLPPREVPGKFADLVKNCLYGFFVDGFKINEMTKTLAKETRIVPELAQTLEVLAEIGMTGTDPTYASFTVRGQVGFEWLYGTWDYYCGGREAFLKVFRDNKGVWWGREYHTQSRYTSYDIHFHVEADGPTPVLVIDHSNLDRVPRGTRLRVRRDGANVIWLRGRDLDGQMFYQGEAPPYC